MLLASYLPILGDLMSDGTPVRGIQVAWEFTSRAILAARVVPNLRLRRHGFRFFFDTMSPAISWVGLMPHGDRIITYKQFRARSQ